MVETDVQALARTMRSTGFVRIYTYDLVPKNSASTSTQDLASIIINDVLGEDGAAFRRDDRSATRAEIRYHWTNLDEKQREKVLRLCFDRTQQNDIVQARCLQDEVFGLIYEYLNTQVT